SVPVITNWAVERKFNSSGEIYEISYPSNDTTEKNPVTLQVTWADGNIVEAKGKNSDEVYTYEYLPNTNGRSFLSQIETIIGIDYSFYIWMVYPTSKQAYSKNFLKRRIYRTAGTENILENNAFFDEDGRVNHMIETVTINGKVTSVDT